jgi:hypothetical protein
MNCEKRLLALSCMSVRPSERSNSAATGRIFMKIRYISIFFRKSVNGIQVLLQFYKKSGYFTRRLSNFYVILLNSF